jgi:hypothetical protein
MEHHVPEHLALLMRAILGAHPFGARFSAPNFVPDKIVASWQ